MPLEIVFLGWAGFGLIGWEVVKALREGQIRRRGVGFIRRDESPLIFWASIVTSIPLLAIFAWLASFAFGRVLAN